MKNILYRHRVTVLAFALVVSIAVSMWYRMALADEAPTPPTKVVVTASTVTDQGVEINWIAAQPGTNPIDTYVVQKRGQDGDFTKIDQVGADSLSYIDASGQAGDAYRVIAEDNQDPPATSEPSDLAVAVAEEPGSSVAVVPPEAAPTPDSIATPQNSSPEGSNPAVTEDKVVPLQNSITQNVATLDTAISKNDTTKSSSVLNTLQGYHQQILSSFPHLTTPQKQAFARNCQEQLPILETSFLLLPEGSQSDGMMVLAGCEAIRELSP